MVPADRHTTQRHSTVGPLSGPAIVTFPVELDAANARRYGAELLLALQPDVMVVIADLSLTQFCDSSGIRNLLLGSDAARLYGSELRVVVPSATVRRALQVFGADQVLRLYLSMAEALAG